jgi:hypothetical protein
MGLDIRIPIGAMFAILGVLLSGFGVYTTSSDIYKKSLDINVNLWWGLAMLVFGAAMFWFGRRADNKPGGGRKGENGPPRSAPRH